MTAVLGMPQQCLLYRGSSVRYHACDAWKITDGHPLLFYLSNTMCIVRSERHDVYSIPSYQTLLPLQCEHGCVYPPRANPIFLRLPPKQNGVRARTTLTPTHLTINYDPRSSPGRCYVAIHARTSRRLQYMSLCAGMASSTPECEHLREAMEQTEGHLEVYHNLPSSVYLQGIFIRAITIEVQQHCKAPPVKRWCA